MYPLWYAPRHIHLWVIYERSAFTEEQIVDPVALRTFLIARKRLAYSGTQVIENVPSVEAIRYGALGSAAPPLGGTVQPRMHGI